MNCWGGEVSGIGVSLRSLAARLSCAVIAILILQITLAAHAFSYVTTHGDKVETEPHVYQIYWGGGWNSGAAATARGEGERLYSEIAAPGSGYQGILTQYWQPEDPPNPAEATRYGFISHNVVVGHPYIDEGPEPQNITEASMIAEIESAISVANARGYGWPTLAQAKTDINDQFVLLMTSAASFQPATNWCGAHYHTDGGYVFDMVRWTSNCGITPTGSHEYAEAATDPYYNGWRDWGYGEGEIADICGGEYGTLPTNNWLPGEVQVVGLKDNSSGWCSTLDASPAQTHPVITTEAATEITPREATLHSSVSASEIRDFTGAYRWGTCPTCNGGLSSTGGGSVRINELQPNTTYYFRYELQGPTPVYADLKGAQQTFTTPDWSPTVSTDGAEESSPHIYTLHAKVNPHGFSTTYGFKYGEGQLLNHVVEAKTALTGEGEQEVSLDIEGLKGETQYSYQVFATNSGNGSPTTKQGAAKTFTTPDWRPVVSTEGATGTATFEEGPVDTSQATLHGLINPRARDTHYRFSYGTSPYKAQTFVPVPDGDAGAGTQDVAVEEAIHGLAAETTYYFHLIAENEEGVSEGEVESFTTPEWALLEAELPAEATGGDLNAASCAAGGECVAVGSYNAGSSMRPFAELRQGGSLTQVEVPNPPEDSWARLDSVSCGQPSVCLAVGRYAAAGTGVASAFAEEWNGEAWTLVSVPAPAEATGTNLGGVSCISAENCVAAGYFSDSSGKPHTLVERWNGSEFSIEQSPDPAPQNYLYDVSCSGAGDCWAVGQSTFEKGTSPEALVEHYEGGEWNVEMLTEAPEELRAVSCPTSASCVALVGEGLTLERYSEGGWSRESAAEPSGTFGMISSVSCPSAGACTVVGSYIASDHTAPLAERWDGTAWEVTAPTDPAGLGEGVGVFRGVSCSSSRMCIAVGHHGTGKPQQPFVETHRPGGAPSATTGTASGIDTPYATLHGSVNPHGEDTEYQFQYVDDATCVHDMEAGEGEEACFEHAAAAPAATQHTGSGVSDVAASVVVTGLEEGVTYHFRIVASNSQGMAHGAGQTFTMREWSLSSTVDPPPPTPRTEDTLTSTDCPTEGTCIGAGYDSFTDEAVLEVRTGGEWQVFGSVAGEVAGLSCPTATLCRAVGSESGVPKAWRIVESGGSWSIATKGAGLLSAPEGATETLLHGVSCYSETLCVAVGTYYAEGAKPLVERYSEGIWSQVTAPGPPEGSAQKSMLAVSCPSEYLCYTAGEANNAPFVESWYLPEEEWAIVSTPTPEGAKSSTLAAISCSSNKFCMAVGHYLDENGRHHALVLRRGASWSLSPTPTVEEAPGGEDLYSVSCTSNTSCVAVGRRINKEEEFKPNSHRVLEERTLAEAYDGSQWIVEATADPEATLFSSLASVSCASATACTTVGASYPESMSAGQESHTLGEVYE